MRERFKHWERQVVRWSDMDALGHVNNAVYLTYCESARMSFFEATGLMGSGPAPDRGPALVTANLTFKRQVRYPATVDVGLRVAKVGNTSFTLDYAFVLAPEGSAAPGDGASEDGLVAEAQTVVVWTDYAAGRSAPLPEAVRAALADYA